MDKTKKNKQGWLNAFKIILLVLVLWTMYQQLKRWDQADFQLPSVHHYGLLILAFFLMPLNWGLEWLKWKLTLSGLNIQTAGKIIYKSFAAGVISGFLTPNLIGNFLGRMFYFAPEQRPAIISSSLFSNAAQFFCSMFFGITSCYLIGLPPDLKEISSWYALEILLIILISALLLYLFIKKIPGSWSRYTFINRFQEGMQLPLRTRFYLLLISAFRFLIFSCQYYLLLRAFGVDADLVWLLLVWQVFFWSTMLPSLWFGKLLIRETVALWLFSSYFGLPGVVLTASISLWLINHGLTALWGLPYIRFKSQKA